MIEPPEILWFLDAGGSSRARVQAKGVHVSGIPSKLKTRLYPGLIDRTLIDEGVIKAKEQVKKSFYPESCTECPEGNIRQKSDLMRSPLVTLGHHQEARHSGHQQALVAARVQSTATSSPSTKQR